MKEHEYGQRGDHCVATAALEGARLRCVGWNEGKRKKGKITPKVYVGSYGTTIPGKPHMKNRWKNADGKSFRYQVPVARPQMVAMYHEHCGKIDDHNQLGQGVLGLEYRRTTRWEFRFFQTFIRFCMVDAHLAYREFSNNQEMPLLEFVRDVVDGLLDNVEGEAANAAPLRPLRHAPVADGGQGEPGREVHAEKLLSNAEYFRRKAAGREDTSPVGRARLTCRVCKKVISTYCATCTNQGNPPRCAHIVVLCSSRSRDCFVQYHSDPQLPEPARRRR